jgi:uncharacterized membrane protein
VPYLVDKNLGEADRSASPFSSTPSLIQIYAWPNRSLSRNAFRVLAYLVSTAAIILVLPFLGSLVFWVVLANSAVALSLFFVLFFRSYATGNLSEHLIISEIEISVTRINTNGTVQKWEANPYWTRHALRDDGPVESYLTLHSTTGGRRIEFAAFLSPHERCEIHQILTPHLMTGSGL